MNNSQKEIMFRKYWELVEKQYELTYNGTAKGILQGEEIANQVLMLANLFRDMKLQTEYYIFGLENGLVDKIERLNRYHVKKDKAFNTFRNNVTLFNGMTTKLYTEVLNAGDYDENQIYNKVAIAMYELINHDY